MATFPGEPGLAGLIGVKDDGGGGDNWSYKTCKAPVKCHHQQTNTQLSTGRMPFLSPNQQRQSTEGKKLIKTYLIKQWTPDNPTQNNKLKTQDSEQ